ncbi:MAG: hypothetical protein KKD77_20655 [Gammaproteobacteria bacterium]|nr:hypothetical protein [Gammaproteobacteria bacterium]
MDDERKELSIPKGMYGRSFYPDDYKNEAFYIWYISGKPRLSKFKVLLKASAEGTVPHNRTLTTWIHDFVIRGQELDKQVEEKLETAVIEEKIEMLQRQAEIAMELQEIAVEYLRAHKDKLNPQAAVRLWVDGVRVERESRGLPSLITEISQSSNEDLEGMIDKILSGIDMMPGELESGEDAEE